ncbi:SHOCT domain-containing protein [Streptomyces sp. N35]|uniref:SHOCT domain-containing protein n=1 Tax=Streptomyces sp. N35 TaxID=2795730 RepID=UPI0018F3D45F|nr:SHOCT domain-containing protein [Streptomyces sp. N35]
MNGWGWLLAGLSSLLLLVLVAAVVVAVLRWTGHPAGVTGHSAALPTPLETLAQRFARGEIDETAYRRAIAALREQDAGPVGPGKGPSAP